MHSISLHLRLLDIILIALNIELGTEALPRMYQVTYASGVRQIMYFMENPREYSINDRTYLLISTKTKVFMLYENGAEVHITGKPLKRKIFFYSG